MSTELTESDLDRMPTGALVIDADGDVWAKDDQGDWMQGEQGLVGWQAWTVLQYRPVHAATDTTTAPLDLPALVSAEREADRLALAAARDEVARAWDEGKRAADTQWTRIIGWAQKPDHDTFPATPENPYARALLAGDL